MKTKLFLFFIFLPVLANAQTDSTKTKRFGIVSAFDVAYNLGDRVISPYLATKWSAGLRFTNKKKQFIGIVAAGIKAFKFNVYSPRLQGSFLEDVKQHYVPVPDTSESQMIGAIIGSGTGDGFWGSNGYCLHFGFMLNNKWKPAVHFYCGQDFFYLYNRGLARYEDPVHGDIDYVGMGTNFYELKLGCALPFKWLARHPFSLNINAGYKLVDYDGFKFGDTPLSYYTTGGLDKKYRYNGKITLSLSFMVWSKL